MDGTVITTAAWVPRGYAAPLPTKYNFDEAEFNRIADLAQLQLQDAQEDLEEVEDPATEDGPKLSEEPIQPTGNRKERRKAKQVERPKPPLPEDDDDLKEYDLDHYDDDEDEESAPQAQSMSIFGNVKSLAYYDSNTEDPYITLGEGADDDDDEHEEMQILATDNLLLAAKVEDELAHLEVYVYEDEADNLYVHHDIMLPAIPLCVEWLDIAVGKEGTDTDRKANYVAIGTIDPQIEIWDLDIVDGMYPNAILGDQLGGDKKEGKKKKKKKTKQPNSKFHVDSVLALAANRSHRHLLASASADSTVKLWDLNTAKCAQSYSYHTDKVCSLAWHPTETTVLLSGSYDRTIVAADMRAPDAEPHRWTVESDVEAVQWDPHNPNCFFVSTESGMIHYHDTRKILSLEFTKTTKSQAPVWKLQAHDESVPCFDINRVIPGYMATGSTDRTVKLWNLTSTGPTLVTSRNFDVGNVFAATFAPDAEVAFRLAVAGSKGSMTVWDTSTNVAVRKAFAHNIKTATGDENGTVHERVVGVVDDDEETSSDDDEDNGEAGAPLTHAKGESMDEDVD
jgi:periodic tryptophan protein 1